MATDRPAYRRSLSASGLALDNPAADVRGNAVTDANGVVIDVVVDLMVDDRQKRVRFLELACCPHLIPVHLVAQAPNREIRIGSDRRACDGPAAVENAQAVDPRVVRSGAGSGLVRPWGNPFGGQHNYPTYPYYV